MTGASAFADGKDADALRTIGEVAKALGIRQHVLRYWEENFPGLRPLKRTGGRRLYRPEDIALISRIDQLVHREGYTLRGAKAALDGAAGAAPVGAEMPRPAGDITAQLTAIRNGLAAALAG